jgi:hypothetical protein
MGLDGAANPFKLNNILKTLSEFFLVRISDV